MANEKARITELFSGRLPKENENIVDCQDFYKCDSRGRVAIADGASQSFYSNIWAEKLVTHFCEDPNLNESNWEHWLQPIQKSWLLDVDQRVKQAREDNKPTWVTNQNRLKFGECATSTFVGVEFVKGQVKISVVGDSYLFILEEKQLIATYPKLVRADEFGDRPEYLASHEKDNNFQPILASRTLKDIDSQMHLILATDALSEYIFRCHERNEDIFSTLLSFSDAEEFKNFIFNARHSQAIKLKNDDVALVILRVSSNIKNNNFIRLQTIKDEIYIDNNIRKERNYIENSLEKESLQEESSSLNFLSSFSKFLSKFLNKAQTKSLFEDNFRPQKRQKKLNAEAKINSLKRQRILLIIWGTVAFLFIVGDRFLNHDSAKIREDSSSTNTTNLNTIDLATGDKEFLSDGMVVYEDRALNNQIIQVSQVKDLPVEVIERSEEWFKFRLTLYAYQPKIQDKKVKVTSEIGVPLYVKPDIKDDAFLFGNLLKDGGNAKLKFCEDVPWYQVELEGYVRK